MTLSTSLVKPMVAWSGNIGLPVTLPWDSISSIGFTCMLASATARYSMLVKVYVYASFGYCPLPLRVKVYVYASFGSCPLP